VPVLADVRIRSIVRVRARSWALQVCRELLEAIA